VTAKARVGVVRRAALKSSVFKARRRAGWTATAVAGRVSEVKRAISPRASPRRPRIASTRSRPSWVCVRVDLPSEQDVEGVPRVALMKENFVRPEGHFPEMRAKKRHLVFPKLREERHLLKDGKIVVVHGRRPSSLSEGPPGSFVKGRVISDVDKPLEIN
jgi:hypothetical protein